VIAGVVTGEDGDEREGCGGKSGWICTGKGIVGGWMRNGEMFMKWRLACRAVEEGLDIVSRTTPLHLTLIDMR
jgi:hypothetical protein